MAAEVPGRLRRVGRALRAEIRKSRRQPALLVYLLLVLLVTLAWGPLRYRSAREREREILHPAAPTQAIEGEEPAEPSPPPPETEGRGVNGFLVLAASTRAGVILTAILLLLYAATLLAGEGTAGTVRLLLVRPVTRTDLLLAKAVLLLLLILLFLAVVAAASGLLGLLLGGYGDIVDVRFGEIDFTASELRRAALVGLGLAPLALFATAAFGLFCSALFESAATAVTVATLGGLAALAVTLGLSAESALLVFVTHVDRYLAVFQSFATGLSDHALNARFVTPGLVVPAVSALVFLGAARIIFCRKEIHA